MIRGFADLRETRIKAEWTIKDIQRWLRRWKKFPTYRLKILQIIGDDFLLPCPNVGHQMVITRITCVSIR